MAKEDVALKGRGNPGVSSQESWYEVPSEEPKIVDYDFRQPQRFSKDRLETIHGIYDTFARVLAASMGTHVRISFEVKVDDIHELSYGEFISSLSGSTCLGIVDMEPWKGASLVEVATTVILAIIDRLLGGQVGAKKGEVKRELTEIELEVAKGIFERVLESLKRAWAEIEELDLKLRTLATNPERVQLIPPEEIVLVATLGIKIGELEGVVRHCLPYNLLEPIAERLTSEYRYSADQKIKTDTEILERLRQGVQAAPIPVIAELGMAQISMGDILGLQIGDVLKLTTKANGNLILIVGGQKKFLCRPGVAGSRMGVQIIQPIGKE